MTSNTTEEQPATVRRSNTIIGSYYVLRDVGAGKIEAAVLTPFYHFVLRPQAKILAQRVKENHD